MVITTEILDLIYSYGGRSYPYSDVAMLIGNTKEQRSFILDELSKPDSEASMSYRRGKISHEDDIDDSLEDSIKKGSEYADEMAKALNFRRKNRQLDNLKEQLFGI
jgi:hypothetical protein